MTLPTWAVVPSEGRDLLYDCLASLYGQVDGIVIVANNGFTADDVTDVTIVHDTAPDRNISRWWNLGLDAVQQLATARAADRWNTLVVNDDLALEQGSVARLAAALRGRTSTLAFPGPASRVLTEPGGERITGYCFMLRGENALRADERYAWWYGDNNLDWTARAAGGTVTVPGIGMVHADPNGYTNRIPALAAQAGRDRDTFLATWGRLPH